MSKINKYQEAIKRVELDFEDSIEKDNVGMVGRIDIERLQELADKEIPMKPIDINGAKYCGKCKLGLIINGFMLSSCHNLDCRQVVDWSDELWI